MLAFERCVEEARYPEEVGDMTHHLDVGLVAPRPTFGKSQARARISSNAARDLEDRLDSAATTS